MSTLSTAAKNAAVGAVAGLIDGGSGAGKCVLTDGGSTVCTFTLSDPAFASAADGGALASSLPKSATATGSGDVDGFSLRTSADTEILSGTAGESAADLILDNASINAGQSCSLDALAFTFDLALVFADEFGSGSAPSATRYFFYPSWGDNDHPTTDPDFLQGESDTRYGAYTQSAASISGGNLVLTASDTPTQYGGLTFDNRTALIRTKQAFLYGVFQARVRLPAGQGFWPALWLMPPVYTGGDGTIWEIDLLEAPSTGDSRAYFNVHWGEVYGSGDHHQAQTSFDDDFSDGFHDFELRWSASEITWWVDGVQRKQFDAGDGDIPNVPLQFLIDFQVGGPWPGFPDGTTPWPSDYLCAHLRVWQET